jgi:uncharacterized membrane protein
MKAIFTNKKIILSLLIFGVLYTLISVVNHFVFRTYALDLGAYTNALYDYAHLQMNDSTVFKNTPENLLADHFDIYLILLSPLSLIFKTYTLLIVQIFMILIGSIGVYTNFSDKKIGFAAMLYFLSFFGVFSALAFDYHSNVIAACLVPWFFLHIKNRNITYSILFLVLILIAKENMALWTFFISIGLLIHYWNDKVLRYLLSFCAVLSIIYFILVLSYFMPLFANNNSYPHFHYSVLGSNSKEALIHLITNPIESFQNLFINHNNTPNGDYLKLELHILLLISGLPILLRKPQFLLMLVPIYFQKLYHDNIIMWGVHAQYSIEFAPILAIGIFMIITDLKNKKLKIYLAYFIVILNIACAIRVMDNTAYISNKTKIRFYKSGHYTKEYDINLVKEQLSLLPKDAIISSQSVFITHLAFRDFVYQFPNIKDAEYIIVSSYESSAPLSSYELEEKISQIENSNEWETTYNFDGFKIFKRKK